eukprot:gene7757-10540_t
MRFSMNITKFLIFMILFHIYFGGTIPEYSSAVNFTESLKRIKDCGFYPESILDVGANVGLWSSDLRNNTFTNSTYFLIEANPKHKLYLEESGFPFFIGLVGKSIQNVTYYHNTGFSNATGNSIYKENTDYFHQNSVPMPMTTTTIDNIIKNYYGKEGMVFQMIKFDIQGSELLALKGATKTLHYVDVIITEVPFMNYNEGSPSFLKLYSYLDKVGFAPYDLIDILRHPIRNVLIQCDVLWVRKSSFLWNKECTGYPPPTSFKRSRSNRIKNHIN